MFLYPIAPTGVELMYMFVGVVELLEIQPLPFHIFTPAKINKQQIMIKADHRETLIMLIAFRLAGHKSMSEASCALT